MTSIRASSPRERQLHRDFDRAPGSEKLDAQPSLGSFLDITGEAALGFVQHKSFLLLDHGQTTRCRTVTHG
jgi:hypothetical protein